MQFDEELLKRLEMEKSILEDKVERARYGFIVSRKEYYRKLIKEMEEFTINLSYKVEQSNSTFNDLLQVEVDKFQIYDKLYELVEGTVKIDS